MAEQMRGRGTALKKASQAGATYQGSVATPGFNPVVAANDDKAVAGKIRQIERDNQIKLLELNRTQQAETAALKAQHSAISGKLQLDQRLEQNELKQEQLYDKNTFELKKNWITAQDQLNLAGLQAKHTVEASNLKLINSIISLSTSFAGDYLNYQSSMVKVREQEAAVASLLGGGPAKVITPEGAYSVSNGLASSVETEKANTNAEIINETAITTVAGDDGLLAENLRKDSANARTQRILGKQDARFFSSNFLAAYTEAWSSDLQIQLPNGKIIRPSEAAIDEINMVGLAITGHLASQAGLSVKDAQVIASEIVPAITQARQNVDSKLISERWKAKTNERVEVAKTEATQKYQSGKYGIPDLFEELVAGITISGKHGGDKTAINDEAVKHLIEIFKNSDGGDISLEALKNVEKIRGNKGTRLGTTYGDDIDQAITWNLGREARKAEVLKKQQKLQLDKAKITHHTNLRACKKGDDVCVIKATQQYEQVLKGIGGIEAHELLVAERKKDDSINPALKGILLDEIALGRRVSEAELRDHVANNRFPNGETDAEEIRAASGFTKEGVLKILKPFQKDWNGQVKALLQYRVQFSGSEAQSKVLTPYVNDIQERLNVKMDRWLSTVENPSKSEINQQASVFTQEIINSQIGEDTQISSTGTLIKSGTNQPVKYEFFTARERAATKVKFENGVVGMDLTQYSTDEIQDFDFKSINYYTDRILSDVEFDAALVKVANGEYFDLGERIDSIVEGIREGHPKSGFMPLHLLRQAASQRGLDFDQTIKQLRTVNPTGRPQLGLETGADALLEKGFSLKGANMISSQIQAENGWSIPEEKLDEIIVDMQENFPEAYRLLTDPNGTDSQVRRAGIIYWGATNESLRYQYYRQLKNQS